MNPVDNFKKKVSNNIKVLGKDKTLKKNYKGMDNSSK